MAIKNSSFQEKVKEYAKSSYLDARTIASKNSWTENDIISRQSKMARLAVNVWKTVV